MARFSGKNRRGSTIIRDNEVHQAYYDTYYSIDSEDMDCEERNAIRRDKGYISPELQELLFSYNLEDGIEDDD